MQNLLTYSEMENSFNDSFSDICFFGKWKSEQFALLFKYYSNI